MNQTFTRNWFEPQAQRLTFLLSILLHTSINLGHFLKQTKNPLKKYYPHKDQLLTGVEPRVWKRCERNNKNCWVVK